MTKPEPDIFPSLTQSKHKTPYGWIQWKGTEVCMDVHCSCGALCHVDSGFCYHIKCTGCGQIYEVGGHVVLYPLGFVPDHVGVVDAEPV